MDYEKKYNKLVNAIKALQEANSSDEGIQNWVNDNVPELAESEGEKTRKALISFLKSPFVNENITDEKVAPWLAWLEKQGDKIEPKFKNGQWIVFNGLTLYVNEVVQGYYRTTSIGGISNSYDWNIDNAARLWTIQDAKDGDVLHSIGWHNDCIFIFNGLDNWKFDEPNGDRAVATGYCCLFVSADKMEFGIQGPDCIEANTVKPATKEQRDILFQKMKEAGYEWDADKKELKKIDSCSDCTNHKGCINCENGSLNETQKSSWSEEDENCLSTIIAEFSKCAGKSVSKDAWMRCNDFLNSLRDRVYPKQEWSEEDENRFNNLIFLIEHSDENKATKEGFIKFINKLKSIKEKIGG